MMAIIENSLPLNWQIAKTDGNSLSPPTPFCPFSMFKQNKKVLKPYKIGNQYFFLNAEDGT